MIIDINAEKEKRNCGHCKHSNSNGGCNSPDYEMFITKAWYTGFCEGFEEKECEKNGK